MAGSSRGRRTRGKGAVDELESGALRVRVYAGIDPMTQKRLDLIEVVPPGPKAWRAAEEIRDRLVREVAEQRNPRTNATLDQLLQRYRQVSAETVDAFYGQLRRCRSRCTGRRRQVEHHTEEPHSCDQRCRPHECQPLAATTIRHIHFVLSAAYKKAVRWRWVNLSPIALAEPPPAPKPNPQPPTPAEAARIVNASWRDPDWGTFIWTAMTTGMRRGEICAVRVSDLDLTPGRETIWLRHALRREQDGSWVEGGLKTHQQRRIALDAGTVVVLQEHLDRCRDRARSLGLDLPDDAYLFSLRPDGSE